MNYEDMFKIILDASVVVKNYQDKSQVPAEIREICGKFHRSVSQYFIERESFTGCQKRITDRRILELGPQVFALEGMAA